MVPRPPHPLPARALSPGGNHDTGVGQRLVGQKSYSRIPETPAHDAALPQLDQGLSLLESRPETTAISEATHG